MEESDCDCCMPGSTSVYNHPFLACSYITTAATTLASTGQHQCTHLCRIFSHSIILPWWPVFDTRVVDVFGLLSLSSERATTIVHRATTHTS
jgi:hypothetical protein